jgi:hypothetical protein
MQNVKSIRMRRSLECKEAVAVTAFVKVIILEALLYTILEFLVGLENTRGNLSG